VDDGRMVAPFSCGVIVYAYRHSRAQLPPLHGPYALSLSSGGILATTLHHRIG
jgi:hypothetical protein